MNRIATILILIVLMVLTPTMASGVDQAYHTLLRAHIYGDESATGQWNYGNLEIKFDDTDFIVTSTFSSTGGVWTVDLEAGIGAATTIVAQDGIVITGAGTDADPFQVSANPEDFTGAGLAYVGGASPGGDIQIATDGVLDTMIDWGTGATQVSGSDLPDEDLGDVSITSGVWAVDDVPADTVLWDEIGDPGGNQTIGFANKTTTFNFTNPAGGWLWNITGAGTSHYLEVNQNTGNPDSDTHLLHLEADDKDVELLHIAADNPDNASGSDAIAMLIDSDDNDDTDFVPIIVRDDSGGDNDELFRMDYMGGFRSGGSIKLLEMADAIADTEAYGQVWVNTATPNELWFTDDAGNDYQIGPVPTQVAGNDTELQYNNGGAFGGCASAYWDDVNMILAVGTAPTGTPTRIFEATGDVDIVGDLQGDTLTMSGAVDFDSTLDVIGNINAGDTSNQGRIDFHNGGGESISVYYPDLGPGIDAGLELPTNVPVVGLVLEVTGVAGNVATTRWQADTDTHVDSIFGYLAGEASGGGFTDTFANIDPLATIAYAGTGATDVFGYALPWNVSIVGISANYDLDDDAGVSSLAIIPYEDGAAIDASNCKLTLAETGGDRDGVSATFATGTYTVSANQTLGIYIDVTAGVNPVMNDLIITVYYDFSL